MNREWSSTITSAYNRFPSRRNGPLMSICQRPFGFRARKYFQSFLFLLYGEPFRRCLCKILFTVWRLICTGCQSLPVIAVRRWWIYPGGCRRLREILWVPQLNESRNTMTVFSISWVTFLWMRCGVVSDFCNYLFQGGMLVSSISIPPID